MGFLKSMFLGAVCGMNSVSFLKSEMEDRTDKQLLEKYKDCLKGGITACAEQMQAVEEILDERYGQRKRKEMLEPLIRGHQAFNSF